jgi:hypothetical protein
LNSKKKGTAMNKKKSAAVKSRATPKRSDLKLTVTRMRVAAKKKPPVRAAKDTRPAAARDESNSTQRSPSRRELYPALEPFRHGYLRVSEVHEIYYEECGNPAGKPAVFLHGGPGAG